VLVHQETLSFTQRMNPYTYRFRNTIGRENLGQLVGGNGQDILKNRSQLGIQIRVIAYREFFNNNTCKGPLAMEVLISPFYDCQHNKESITLSPPNIQSGNL
jgi:hypothetical protein